MRSGPNLGEIGASTKWNKGANVVHSALLSLKCSVVKKRKEKKSGPFLSPTTSTAPLSCGLHLAPVTMTMESSSQWGEEGPFETRADREREECDSD